MSCGLTLQSLVARRPMKSQLARPMGMAWVTLGILGIMEKKMETAVVYGCIFLDYLGRKWKLL